VFEHKGVGCGEVAAPAAGASGGAGWGRGASGTSRGERAGWGRSAGRRGWGDYGGKDWYLTPCSGWARVAPWAWVCRW